MTEWQDDFSTAPKDEAVWIYCDDGMRHVARISEEWDWKRLRYVGKWEVLWPDTDKVKNITHWMPLPEPPATKDGERA